MTKKNNNRIQDRPWLPPRLGMFPLGSIESRAAARAFNLAAELERQRTETALRATLTSFQRTFVENSGCGFSYGVLLMANMMEQKSRLFGWALPTAEELRYRHRVAQEMAKIRKAQPTLNDNTIRQMAEEILKTETPRSGLGHVDEE